MNKNKKGSRKVNVVFNPEDYQGGSVVSFNTNIEALYKARGSIKKGISQREQTGIYAKGQRLFATTLHNCSFVDHGNVTAIKKSAKQIFGLDISKDNAVYGGSISLFTFTVKKRRDGKKVIYEYDNRNSAHRMCEIVDIIENKIPLPKRVSDEFGDTNDWLDKFWSSQSEEVQNSNLYFEDLPETMQKLFKKSSVVVQIYDVNGNEAFAREIFTITNDCTSVKSHEAINNSFVKMVPFYDCTKVLAAIIIGHKPTLKKEEFADDIEAVKEAIPEDWITLLQKSFRKVPGLRGDKGIRIDTMIAVLERNTYIQGVGSANEDAWTGSRKQISAQLYTKYKDLTHEQSLELLKEVCRTLCAVCTIFPCGEKSLSARHNLGLINGCAYMLVLEELENPSKSKEEVLNNCIKNKETYRSAISKWIIKDVGRASFLTTTPHDFGNARQIALALNGGK